MKVSVLAVLESSYSQHTTKIDKNWLRINLLQQDEGTNGNQRRLEIGFFVSVSFVF